MNAFIFIGLIAVMWAALIVPQQRRAKRQRELVSSLGVGDDVMLASGIYGTITGEDDDDIFLNIAEGVEIRVARAAVSSKVEFEDDDGNDTAGSDGNDTAGSDGDDASGHGDDNSD